MHTAIDVRAQVVELAREFARDKIEPFAAEWDRTKHFPRDVIDEMGKLGFFGMCAPEAYDGMGLDALTYIRLSRSGCQDSTAFGVTGFSLALPWVMMVVARNGPVSATEPV